MKSSIKVTKKKVLVTVCILGVILSTLLLYRNRHLLFFTLGNTFFGYKILGVTLYTIDYAEYFFLQTQKGDPSHIWLNYQLSRINFIKGDLERAVMYADKELAYHPDNCRTHYIRGLSYGYMERLNDAIVDFEAFNTCFPDTWAGHNDLAWFWFRKGNVKKMLEVSEAGIKKGNNAANPWLQNTYGIALMNTGRLLAAENAFLMAKYLTENMTEDDWGRAYPGNNPEVYDKGFAAMRQSIMSNLLLVKEKRTSPQKVLHTYPQ